MKDTRSPQTKRFHRMIADHLGETSKAKYQAIKIKNKERRKAERESTSRQRVL